MTSLISTSDVQALGVGLALSDAALQTVIDREEAELVTRFGDAAASRAETVYGNGRSLFLKRAIASITSIVEYLYPGDTSPITLTATDYFIWGDEGRLERLPWGSTGRMRWGTPVIVTYTPVDDTSLRKTVLFELVRIGVEEPASGGGESVSGLGFSVGGKGSAPPNWVAQRAAQYARLGWLDR